MSAPVTVVELDPRYPVLVTHEDASASDSDTPAASGWHS